MIQETRGYKYALHCADPGNDKVGIYVKKQCRQWLEIADGKVPGKYVSESEYKRISGMLRIMVHPDLSISMYEGLEDYAMLFITAVLCTLREDSRRLYNIGILEIARKNFKTFVSAVIFIILMLTEPRFARFFSVAPDYKLSSELRLSVRKIVKCSPLLEKHFKITRDMITCKLTDTEYTPLAYSNDRMDGKLANAFLADEDGAMDSYPTEAMTSSQINLPNRLGIIISTRYPNENNDFDDRLDLAKKILDGLSETKNIFSLLYEPDSDIINDWETDDRVLYQANPVIADKPLMLENLIEKRETAVLYENTRENFLCKHCNIKYKGLGTEGYVPIDKVQACRTKLTKDFWRGRRVYLGNDLSLSDDNTAVAMATYEDGVIYALVMGFIPLDSVDRKTNKENFNYRRAIAAGNCIACGDLIIDYSVVEDYILGLSAEYGVEVVAAGWDRANAISSMQKLESAEDPIECTIVKQHSSVLHPATKLLKESILSGNFRYEENLLLENNFENARCVYDTNLNMYVNKKYSAGKVDMVVALVNAVHMLIEYEINGDDFVIQCVEV